MAKSMAPAAPLKESEDFLQSFCADRAAYVRGNAWLAATAMIAGMLILWFLGNPHIWTGAVGGLAAVTVRASYLMSEALSVRWDLTTLHLLGPMDRKIKLAEIKVVNTLGSTVQIVTSNGEKHLIKYQADTQATIVDLRRARARQAVRNGSGDTLN